MIKKIMCWFSAIAIILGLQCFTGCKTVPNADTLYVIAYTGGAGTGLVLNETKIDAEKRAIILGIVKEVRKFAPEVGQPLESALLPIAQEYVGKLKEEGKIDAAAYELIMAGFRTIMTGINVLEMRYPEIRSNRDLAASTIAGFADGFIAKFSVDGNSVRGSDVIADQGVMRAVRDAAIKYGIK